jgi:hypothetical protein
VYLLVFYAYINEMHGSRRNPTVIISSIYDVKFLALLGAPYIYDISRLKVKGKIIICTVDKLYYKVFCITLSYNQPLNTVFYCW